MMILDQHQRVVAANAVASRLLSIANENAMVGKPWSEVPPNFPTRSTPADTKAWSNARMNC